MIDSLKKSIIEVKDGETFQQEMIDQLPVGIFLKQIRDGRYVYWNRACEKTFGMRSEDIIGRTDRELFPKDSLDLMEQEDSEACAGHVVIRNKVLTPRKGEGRVIHLIVASISDSQGNLKYILGIAEDVTPENLNLRMDLLFSITRHEILNQLSEIVGSLERAQLKQGHEDVQSFFDRTLGSVESIKNQIAYMRSLQDIGIISPSWQSLKHTFDDAVHLSTPGKIRIQNDLHDYEVFADPLLPRIFHSIIENSLRYGGPALTTIQIHTEVSSDKLLVVYEDDGAGIQANKKERIFEPGFGEGTGMSLFIIRELLGFTGMAITETVTREKVCGSKLPCQSISSGATGERPHFPVNLSF